MKDKTTQQAATGAALESEPEVDTKQIFAGRMRVSVRTVDNWLKDGKIPCLRLGGKIVRIPWKEARDHLLRKYRVNARGE